MATERSAARIASWIHRKVATMLQRDLNDPRMGFLTVTRVELAKDLETCIVYYSVLGDDAKKRTAQRMLEHATPFIRRNVGAGLRTRTIPKLVFEYDTSIEAGIRMSQLLDTLSKERDSRERDAGISETEPE